MLRLFVFLLALIGPASAQVSQFPQPLPPNTVIGRLGAGVPGPSQAIPFATFLSQVNAAAGIVAGPLVPSAGSTLAADWLWGPSSDRTTLINEGSIWTTNVYLGVGIVRSFNSSATGSGSPAAALFGLGINSGASNAVVGVIGDANTKVSSGTVFGSNFIARSNGGSLTNVKLVGSEIDVEPASGDTVSSTSGGLFINAFNTAIGGPAIQIGGVGGGSWSNGIFFTGTYSGAAISVQTGATSSIGIDFSAVSFTSSSAILLANGSTSQINFKSTTGNPASVYNDSSNNFTFLAGNNNLIKFGKNDASSFPFQFNASSGAATFTTLYGGSAAGSSLTLQSTSSGSPSGDQVLVAGSKLIYETIGGSAVVDYGSTDSHALAVHGASDAYQLRICSTVDAGCAYLGGNAFIAFQVTNSGGSTQMSVDTSGNVVATAGFKVNGGTAGITQTCTVNQAKTLIFTLGILTGGSCNT